MANCIDNHLIENNQVRIFLSSTFSDMQEERDALIQRFELLKIEASMRNVSLTVVDLRWGVTEQEAKSGKVISVCLNEIENSHPFFIGLLGYNYGTAPDPSELEKNPELKERYNWIEKAISDGMSITEMEIQYGVLCNNDDVDAVFFFKKSNQSDNNKRLTVLKEKVREKYDPNFQNDYETPSELCEKVADEVRKIIDKHFPERAVDTPLDRERSAQRAYINSRHSYYYERQSYFDYIDLFVQSDEQNLVFTGESGIGKSALLANWITKNENNPDFNLVYHFVGNSFSGNNYENILRHICDEIYDLYEIKKDEKEVKNVEDEAQKLVDAVSSYQKPLIIVVDGINQIVSVKNEKLLLWLPSANKRVKFIFSTLPDDDTMKSFKRRNIKTIEEIKPLEDSERKEWIPYYLKRVGKRLDDDKKQLERIVDNVECKNMLVLRTLLDELTCFGIHEKVDERISYYLTASSIPDFYDRFLQRMEEDYSADQDLVRHVLMLLSISEHGLSENELLAILGLQQQPLNWHLFFCAFYNHFVVRNGIITFSHQYIMEAVNRRYCTMDSTETSSFRQEIVAYFTTLPKSNRVCFELSFQYYNLTEWDSLYNMLSDSNVFTYLYESNQYLLALYWRTLQSLDKAEFSISVYKKYTTESAANASFLNNVAGFVIDFMADFKLALEYNQKSFEISNTLFGKENSITAEAYNLFGFIYHHFEDYHKAVEYFLMDSAICENKLGIEHPDTASSYSNIGFVYDTLGEYNKALAYYNKALDIRIKIDSNHPDTAVSYHNIGYIYFCLGDYNKALKFYSKAKDIFEWCLGLNHPNTACSYDNIGLVYLTKGDYDLAFEYYSKALSIRCEKLGLEHPAIAVSYNNLASLYNDLGNYKKALELGFESLAIRMKVFGPKHSDTAISFNNIGFVYDSIGDFDKALECYSSALEIWEDNLGPDHTSTAASYGNIGDVYLTIGDYDKAWFFYSKALTIYERVLGLEHPYTAGLYNNIGSFYNARNDYDKALEYYNKALKIWVKALGPEHPNVAKSYNNIGYIYSIKEDYKISLDYYFKSLEIREKVYGVDHPDTAASYDGIGLVLCYLGKCDMGLKYLYKALRICEIALGPKHPNTITTKENIDKMLGEKKWNILSRIISFFKK